MRNKFAILSYAVLCAVISSCGQTATDEDAVDVDSRTGLRIITVSCAEEHAAGTVSGTRAASRGSETDGGETRLYGINVYRQSDSGCSKYAYGLFDTAGGMTLILPDSGKYKIECLEVRTAPGTDTICHTGDMYRHPFALAEDRPAELSNKFVYSSEDNLFALGSGRFQTMEGYKAWQPQMYTYYAEAADFDPAGNDMLRLTLKRAYFGLRFIVTPPKSGSATFTYLGDKSFTVNAGDSAYDREAYYSYHNIREAWRDGYTSSTKLKMAWTHTDGSVETDSATVPTARNNLTVARITLSGKDEGISIGEEDGGTTTTTFDWTFGRQ